VGEDLRYVDWNIYARLERFFLKLFHEEEDLTVYVLVDLSASMSAGEPSKSFYAKRLAVALAYIALNNLDRVNVVTFSSGVGKGTQLLRGRGQLVRVVELLEGAETGGVTNFGESAKEFAIRYQAKGLVFVVSDFIDPLHVEEGVKRLVYGGHDVVLIQVLDRGEVEPSIRGDWALVDSESGEVVEVSVGPQLIGEYKRRFNAYLGALRNLARKVGAGYVVALTDIPIEDFLLKELVWTGVVK